MENKAKPLKWHILTFSALYDRKHIPTQKIDINGTLQVAMNSFRMWADKNKCKRVLILGDNDLVKNENLERFFSNLK